MSLSPARRTAIIDALRKGTVPAEGLDQLAVGLDRLAPVIGEELDKVAGGAAVFKAVRGEYGSGKTFFARWMQQQAIERGIFPVFMFTRRQAEAQHLLQVLLR